MSNPVWLWLVRSRESAYGANASFAGPSSRAAGPAWCAARYGQSTTSLPDGRVVRIGGEHEDSYDEDFFIYNDVIVETAAGALDIFGYPYEVFEPTDFHSATLVGDAIFVIGNLGYPERRRTETPVATLDTRSWKMSPTRTTGTSPGWISKHTARLVEGSVIVSGGQRTLLLDGASYLVDDADDWSLETATGVWTRLTERAWQEWRLARADGTRTQLWQRNLAYAGELPPPPALASMFAELGDLATLVAQRPIHASRYSPPIAHEDLPGDEDTVPPVYRRRIDGVVVRYVEDSHAVRVVIEGALRADVVERVLDDACDKLAALEKVPYRKKRLV